MSIKKIETFLWGMLLCFCSCVDDTYDMSKKDISLDMKIEGNCIALPLGNLRPIVLDSVLDLSTISMLKEDSISHVYSIAFNDSVKTRVARKDLSVLKEVSKLSSDIEPVAIGLDEIRFRFPTFEHSDSMSFQNVELSDVSLDAIHEEVELSLGNIKLIPISIAKDSREVNFEIPVVEVDDVYIDEYVESVSFSINDVEAGGQTDGVDKTFEFEVDDISINEISTPKFESYLSTLLSTTEVDVFLAGKGDDFELTSDLDAQFNIHKSDETQVDIKFEYTLPEEVKHLNRVELAHSDANRKGALVEFNVKNPKLLEGLSRSIDFRITFPKNYKLELYDNTYSSLTEDNEIRVVDMPADGDSTFVRFYLKEIGNLNDNKYYNGENGRTLELNDVASCEIDYSVLGRKIFPQGITVAEIKE